MNYGISIIILALIDILTIYSGLPLGTKKGIIFITTLCLLIIGWALRTIEQKRSRRLKEKKEKVEETMMPELAEVESQIAHDVVNQVEHEIDMLTDAVEHDHIVHDLPDETN